MKATPARPQPRPKARYLVIRNGAALGNARYWIEDTQRGKCMSIMWSKDFAYRLRRLLNAESKKGKP